MAIFAKIDFWGLKYLVHNCTIFLCSLDVRNIVQGGDPLYAVFFSTQGSAGYTWPKWVRFFLQKTPVYCVNPRKKLNLREKNLFWGAQAPGRPFLWPSNFCQIWGSFANYRDLIKARYSNPVIRTLDRGLPNIGIDPYIWHIYYIYYKFIETE